MSLIPNITPPNPPTGDDSLNDILYPDKYGKDLTDEKMVVSSNFGKLFQEEIFNNEEIKKRCKK